MKHNNINNELEEKIILNSLGLLENEEQALFKKEIKASSPDSTKVVSEFNNLVSLFFTIPTKKFENLSPPENVKTKLFAKLDSRKNNISDINDVNEKEFSFVFADSDDWVQHSQVEGIKVKQLSVNNEKNYVMLMLKVAAGTEYPSHHHSGAEECYVIEGDLYAQGKILGPGDFHHAGGGTDHEPLYTKNGCTVILVVDPEDY